jgi:hypothetical protein
MSARGVALSGTESTTQHDTLGTTAPRDVLSSGQYIMQYELGVDARFSVSNSASYKGHDV